LSLAENRALARVQKPRFGTSVILTVFGLACLFAGGRFLVSGAVGIARIENVSQAVVGLTLVAAATAVPTLVTTLFAVTGGVTNVVSGQLIGANVLNILFVLGVTASVQSLSVPAEIRQADAYVVAASAGAVVAMMLPGWRITRTQGALLFVSYVGYLCFLAWRQEFMPV
jgi:cation:H+ antiporter